MNKDYPKYCLSGNPFPQSAAMDVYSDDPRSNGSIFCEGVFTDEIKELEERLEKKLNLIYLLGFEWEKGVGKSAILVNSWKKLSHTSDIASAYVKCSDLPPLNNPGGFCVGIIKELHKGNLLWQCLETVMKRYVNDVKPIFPKKTAVDTLFNAFPDMPFRLPLSRYTYVSDPKKLSFDMASWLSSQRNMDINVCQQWLTTYLTSPTDFERVLDSRGKRHSFQFYRFFTSLLDFVGHRHLFVFLDQFEDALMPVPNPRVKEFCLGIRRLIETGAGFTTIIVTLHPDGETKLSTMGGENLTQLAPLDTNHLVSVMTLKEKEELAIPLSVAYLEKFRICEPKNSTHPFSEDALRFICHAEGGNIRQILQRLYHCVEFGLEKGIKEINTDAIIRNSSDTIGRELSPEDTHYISGLKRE